MAKKPTPAQIKAELVALKKCLTFVPRKTVFGDDNHAQLNAQIDFLNGDIDLTAPEFEEMSMNEQEAVMQAEQWMDGTGVEGPPSKDWKAMKP